MKLKYTLVFTIISFFIATAGFAQQYSDKEIGFDVERATLSLKEHGVFGKDLNDELAIMRNSQMQQYIERKKIKNNTLEKIKSEQKTKVNRNVFSKTSEIIDIPSAEKNALLAFYNNLNGTSWGTSMNWDFNTPVTNWDPITNTGWRGVTVTNGHVTSLEFLRYALMGQIPSEIGQLPYLETLFLSESHLTGTIPPEIGQLSKLRYLDLSANDIEGSIPVEITQLSNLEYFYMDQNRLTGTITPEIKKLTKLKVLYLVINKLTGPIPSEIGNLTDLESIWLGGNQLDGTLPSQLGQLSKLTFLNLTENKLEGTIPPQLGQLSNLEYLQINQNKLTGGLPPELGQLNKLLNLRLSSNKLEGQIPIEYGQMSSLSSLELSMNELSGNFPSVVAQLPRLSEISISYNKFSGIIPNLAGDKTYLYAIAIHNNKFRFIDFATDYPTYISRLHDYFSYAPQAKTDKEESIIGTPNGSITFTMCEDNRYIENADTFQWYKGVSPNGVAIPGANSRQYTISELSSANSGDYYCLSRNSQITNPNSVADQQNLILERNTIHLTVNDCVNGAIKTNPSNPSLNGALNFFLETTSTNLTYKWTFYNSDDSVASIETSNTVTKSYNTIGNYKVNLVVTDENGCTTSFTKIISICNPISGIIKTTNNNLFVNANTYFYFDTTTTNLTYQWFFHDLEGNIIENQYGNHILKSFDLAGNYKIDLVITDGTGCPTTITKIVSVNQPQVCTSPETGTIFVGDNDTVYVNTNNEFYFDSNTNQNLHHKWTIYNPDDTIHDIFVGNQNYISNLNFESPGNYRVVLEITDVNGCTAVFNKNFTAIYNCGTRNGEIITTNGTYIQPVLPNTSFSVSLHPYGFEATNYQFSWKFLSPNGDILNTGTENTFNVNPLVLGDYAINLEITDPNTNCKYNFIQTVNCLDECGITEQGRQGYITPNGEYGYSNDAIFLDLNQSIEVGIYRPWYLETGKTFNLSWSLFSPDGELVSTGNQTKFAVTLNSSGGFYKVIVNVTDPENGCTTEITRKFTNSIQNSCTQTNERASEVQLLLRNLTKNLIFRSVRGETDTHINVVGASNEDFSALKPYITNSPKDKIYNYKTIRNKYNIITAINFSFSPDRDYDLQILIRDGIDPNYSDEYLINNINDAIYIDMSQYVSPNEFFASCWVYDHHNRGTAKSILEPQDCRYSSEIKNINFCPPPCTSIAGTLKQSTPEVFVNRNTNFSFETTVADLSYKWTFYNSGNQASTVYTTSSVDKTYTQQGSYNINLEITDSNGCITSFDKTVVVTLNTSCAPISGTIKTSAPDVFVGRNTNFSLETTATDLSYKWTFVQSNESTIFTTKTVDYIYIQPGTNNVTLEVTDSNGCKSTFQKLVELKTGSTLCNDVTQFGRAFIQVGTDTNLFKSATVSVNQTTNVTFSSQNYGSGADFEYKWSLLNENNQLVDSGTNLIFPITPTRGGLYTVVLDIKENTSGCIHQFTRAIVCTISNSCAQTNPESATVKGLVINLLKNLMARAMMGESDSQINSSAVTAEFNALKPYITSGPKDKIYNFTSTRNLNGEFTSVSFSFSPDRVSDIYISVPHGLQYSQGMPLDYLQSSMIEPRLYIDLSQYTSANQYLISCLSDSQSAKGLLKPNDCVRASEIRYINFCPGNCNTFLGSIKTNSENISLNTPVNFSVETTATVLNYNWTFYNSDNTVKETLSSATPTQTYTVPGTYKVVVIATDSNNCPTTFTKTIKISSCIPVIGTIKTATEAINENSTTNFYFETAATGLTYQWTFYRNVNANVTVYNTNSVNHFYDVEGSYNIRLIVTDANGCQTIFRKTAVVTKPVCTPVIGTVTTVSNNVFVNKYTQFYLQTDATDLQYSWSFYNLSNTSYTTYTDARPYHTFYAAGNYNVVLAIRDQNGCVTTFNKVLTVTVQPPCVNITGEIKIPNGLIFTDVNNGFSFETQATNVRSYQWTFYDLGSTTTLSSKSISNPSQLYTRPGQYLVELVVFDQNDCTTTFRKYITVSKQCTSITGSISIPTETITTNQSIPFSFDTTATGISYQWTFYNPDGSIRSYATTSTVDKSYTSPGDYLITLEITGQDGCKLFNTKTVHITGECAINGQISLSPENAFLFQYIYLNFETNATDLKYRWEFYDPDNNFVGWDDLTSPSYYLQGKSGDYKIKLEVSDSNGCTSNFEKIINAQYDCSRNSLNGTLTNNSSVYYYRTDLLINSENSLTFYPYGNWNLSDFQEVKWDLIDISGNLVTSIIGENFIFTPTSFTTYILNLTIKDREGCPHSFSYEIPVVDICTYSDETIDGFIGFENENNTEILNTKINETKTLSFLPYKEISRDYTYKWEVYSADQQLISSGNQSTHNLTLTNAGFYKVTFDIENESGCIKQFTKVINCLIENSCTKDNPKSKAVKALYVNLLKNLISRSLKGETDADINASAATAEFNALIPYITNGTKDKIYNYTTVREQNKLISVRFSFSSDRDYDTQVLLTKGLWNFDPEYDGTFKSFTSRLVSEIYIDIEQFISTDQYLISCYNQTPQINQQAKFAVGKNDCYKETEIRYIDFCPAEACAPAEGKIIDVKEINISSKSSSKIKSGSRSKI